MMLINLMDFSCGSFFNVVVEANNDSKKRRVWSWGTMNYVKDKKKQNLCKAG